jgi:FtsZ-binding cell division protein ZapB
LLPLGTPSFAEEPSAIDEEIKRMATAEFKEPMQPRGSEGSSNTSYGTNALASVTSGDKNSAFGRGAMFKNTSGERNTAVGYNALYANTSGDKNIAIGYGALTKSKNGEHNTAIGDVALGSTTTGKQNVAIGSSSMFDNTTGYENTAVGTYSLLNNTKGYYNNAIGRSALDGNTTGHRNAALGSFSLMKNKTGQRNTAVGHAAMYYNTKGQYNTALGVEALSNNTTGKFNTALGSLAGSKNKTGSSNVFIGYKAGLNEKGSQKLYIANSSKSPLVYGDFNKKTLKVNGKMYATKFITSSDARLKTDIRPLNNALDTVLKLQGKQYRLIDEAVNQTDIGLIAQDVEKVLPQIVSQTEDGYKAIAYQSLTAVLIEAIKEQQGQMTTQQQQFTAEITALQKENTELKALVEGQMDALLARVAMLEGVSLVAN